MSTIDREVIIDLLPAYLGGEASVSTKRLVEEFARQDEEIAAMLHGGEIVHKADQVRPAADLELQVLLKTRHRLSVLRWLHAFALAFTLSPFLFGYTRKGLEIFVIRDFPGASAVFLLLASLFWIAYFVYLKKRAEVPER